MFQDLPTALLITLVFAVIMVGVVFGMRHLSNDSAEQRCEKIHPEALTVYGYDMRHGYFHCAFSFVDLPYESNDYDPHGLVIELPK